MATNWNDFTPVDSAAPRASGKVDWSQFEPIKPDDSGDFMRGARVALGQTVPILKGVAGLVGATAENAFGDGGLSTGLKNWGLQGYNEGMAKLAPLRKDTDELTTAWDRAKSGDLGALVDWAQYGLGYAVGQMGESAAMALVGGAAGAAAAPEVAPVAGAAGAVAGIVGKGGVKTLATNLIEKAVVKESQALMAVAAKSGTELAADAAVKQATKNVARNIAATGTLVGYGTAQELGSIYPEAEGEAAKKGEKLDGGDLARVWATGLAAGGVEGLTDKLGLDVALGKVRIPGAGRAGRALLGGTAGALTEGGTEAAQTVLERIGAGQDLTSQDAIHDYINSAGLGAIGGGGLGAVGGMLHPHQQAVQDQAMRDLAGAQTADEAIAAAQRAADAQVSPLAEAQGLVHRAAQRRAARLSEATDAARGEMATSLAPKPSLYPALPAPDGPPTGFTVDANGNAVPTWDDAYRAQARQPEPPPRGPLALPAPEGGPTTIAVDAQGNAAPSWGGNAATVVGESLAGWQARRAEQETLAGWASTHPPVGWDSAVRVVQGAQDRGMDWSVLDHPDGGFMAVPTQYLTPRTATRAGIEFKNRMARVMAPTTERTRQQAGEPQVIEGVTIDQLVRQMVEQRRNDGTLSGRAFAKEFDAGRITPADVLATMPNPEKVSPDERLASAAAQAQPQVDPVTDRLTQIVRQAMAGQPQKTGIALIDSMRKRGSSASAAPAPVIAQAASTSPADQALEATTEGVNHGREEVGQGQGWRPQGLLTEPAGANRNAAPAPSPAAQAIDAVAHEAATSPRNDLPEPTQAQKEAGNYKKGHTTWNGLGLTIENPQGSERSGVDPGGKAWKVTMPAHYGYVKRTEGNDGDQVDLYMGPNPESGRVFVVDQVEARTGEFDEHKAIAGVDSLQQALDLYDAGFSDGKGPQRRGAVTEMSVDQFKAWVRDGVKNRPVGRVQPNDAKRANDRLKNLAATASELAGQIQEEATQRDFRPSELPAIVEQWAQDAKLGAAELRDAVLAIIRKSDLSDGRKVQIARALAKVGAEPAQPTKEQSTDVPQPAPPATQEGQAPGAQAEASKPGSAAGQDGTAGWWNGLTQDQRAAEIARIDLRTTKGKPGNPAHTWMLLSKAAQEKVRGAFETKDTAPAGPSTMPAASGGTPAENKGPVDAQTAQAGPAAAIEPAPTRVESEPAPQESPAEAAPPAAAAPADPLDAKLQASADSLKDGQQVTIQVQVGDTGKTAEMTMGAKDALADVRKRLADAVALLKCLN
jgi:Inorganic Pyrophosphatase